MITSKTINIKADTLASGTMNVEVKMVDDSEINDNRTFKLTIVSANGAKIEGNASTIVTIRDNDAAFYEKFFGKWNLSGNIQSSSGVSAFSKDVTISGETDETADDYDHVLTVSAPGFINVGASIDCEFHLNYNFDLATKKGTIGIVCGEVIATYGSSYEWMWVTDNGVSYTTDDVTAPWALGENDAFPTTITFPASKSLYFYQPGAGAWRILTDLKLTKK